MSGEWIEVDGEVMARIKDQAEPFVDSPNDALRQLLGLGSAASRSCFRLPVDHSPPTPSRAAAGDLLPMAAYELPLLRSLSQLGGSAPRATVKKVVEVELADKLTAADRFRLRNTEERWSNRLGFARLRAAERGHIRRDSRRGIWELTEAGIERLGQLEAEHEQHEREVTK